MLTGDSPVSGIARNQWKLERTSGDSSVGAAVAVACGCGPLALARRLHPCSSSLLRRSRIQADLRSHPPGARLPSAAVGLPRAYRPLARSVADAARARQYRSPRSSGPGIATCIATVLQSSSSLRIVLELAPTRELCVRL